MSCHCRYAGFAGTFVGTFIGLLSPAAFAQSFSLQESPTGHIDFVVTGGSFTDNTGLSNGVQCLRPSASANVSSSVLPAGAQLVKAVLYFGGSLIDDGEDYPGVEIFSNPGLTADNNQDLPILEDAARAAADHSVEFLPPGAIEAVTVDITAAPEVFVLYKPSGNEIGNLGFAVSRVDVTDIVKNQGQGVLNGTYIVSDFLADICYGPESVCREPGACNQSGQTACLNAGCNWTGLACVPFTCQNRSGSTPHTNAAASFALVLTVSDPTLPLRTLYRFDGLQTVASTATNFYLSLPSPISDPARGALGFYVLEGDMPLPGTADDTGPCSAAEYVEVDGDADFNSNGLCLEDDDNPNENLFNGTINVEPAVAPPGTCSDWSCCKGDGLCGLVGVDVDRFDISSALEPGAENIRVTLGTGQDRVYLANLMVGVDIFEPVLELDSQIRILNTTADGYIQIGEVAQLSVVISNTGNVTANGIAVSMDMPPRIADMTVVLVPDGASDNSLPTGGASGTGRVVISDFSVGPGDAQEIRVYARLGCDVDLTIAPIAQVTGTSMAAFSIESAPAQTAGPGAIGNDCEDVDPNGPFAPVDPPRELRGAGCNASATMGVVLLPWLVVMLRRAARRQR